MASTGNVFPTSGTTVDRAGSTAWGSPGNITADDASSASAVVPTDYLIASAFGFTIPATARILGVTVRIEASETGTGSSNYIPQLISATTPTLIGAAKSAITITTGPTISTSGSASDLWSATLTPAIVNNAGFGVAIWSTDTTNTLSIDFVTVAIEWAEEISGTFGDRAYFHRRRTTKYRLLRVEPRDDVEPGEPPPVASPDAALEESFTTRVLSSRRVLRLPTLVIAEQPAAPQVPEAAWLPVPQPQRKRVTKVRLVHLPAMPLHVLVTPEPATFATPLRALKRRRTSVRALEAPVIPSAPTTGPPPFDGWPAFADPQRARFVSFDTRLLLAPEYNLWPRTPNAADAATAGLHRPPTLRSSFESRAVQMPAMPLHLVRLPSAADSAVAGIHRPRALVSSFAVRLQPPTPFLSEEQPPTPEADIAPPLDVRFRTREFPSRKFKRSPHPPVYPETPPIPPTPATLQAFVAPKQHRRRPRQGLFILAPEIVDITPQLFVPAATQLATALKRRATEFRLLSSPHPPVYPATPAQQPVTYAALVQQRATRTSFEVKLQRSPHPAVYPLKPSPLVYPSIVLERARFSRFDVKLQRLGIPPVYPTTAPTPLVYPSIIRPQALRTAFETRLIRAVMPPVYPANPVGAVPQLLRALKRRETHREMRTALIAPVFPANPTGAVPQLVRALRRRATGFELRVALIAPVFPVTPAPPQPEAAFRARVVLRSSFDIELRTLAIPPVYPTQPPVPLVYPSIIRATALRRRETERRHLTAGPAPVFTVRVDQPMTAWLPPPTHRVEHRAALREFAFAPVYPQTPPFVATQRVDALRRRDISRELLAVVLSYYREPFAPEQPPPAYALKLALRRRETRFARQLVELDEFTRTPTSGEMIVTVEDFGGIVVSVQDQGVSVTVAPSGEIEVIVE